VLAFFSSLGIINLYFDEPERIMTNVLEMMKQDINSVVGLPVAYVYGLNPSQFAI